MPPYMEEEEQRRGGYSSSIWGCFDDCRVCCFTGFCTPCAIGRLVGTMEGKEFSCSACMCPAVGAYRARRKIASIHRDCEPEHTSTWLSTLCTPLSVMQDYREWKRVGSVKSTPPSPPVLEMPFQPT